MSMKNLFLAETKKIMETDKSIDETIKTLIENHTIEQHDHVLPTNSFELCSPKSNCRLQETNHSDATERDNPEKRRKQ
jgi:hypothetical protein